MKHIKKNIDRIKTAISVFNQKSRYNATIEICENKPMIRCEIGLITDLEREIIEIRIKDLVGSKNIKDFVYETDQIQNKITINIIFNAEIISDNIWKLKYTNRLGKKDQIKSKGPGIIVKTKSGLRGVLYHVDSETKINGKYPVYLDNGNKMLCSEDKMKMIGFID